VSSSKDGASPGAEDQLGEVLAELRGTRGRLGWIISDCVNDSLKCSLLEADLYLQQVIDAVSRASKVGREP